MKLNDKTYNTLKWIAQYLLPALGTLYFALASIWGLGYGQEIIGTITAVDIFLGVILGLSNASYEGHGTVQIDTFAEEKDVYRLNMNVPLEDLAQMKKVTLNIDPTAKLT
jgi:hypothetical protein